MPNTAAAAKHWRQTKTRRLWNLERAKTFKTAVKKALAASSKAQALELARAAQQALFKAAKRGVIKPNTAARRLSRLIKKLKARAQ